MSYLTREMSIDALTRMKEFERKLCGMYDEFGISLRDDLGRRNMLLSFPQEQFFADVLSENGISAIANGKTGQADITLNDVSRELECKLTSGMGKSKSWSFQTDYITLARKGVLDFLYILADPEFNRFAVLHFESLTVDDFFPPTQGSRNKSRMNKISAMDRCKVLVGSVSVKNDSIIDNYKHEISLEREKLDAKLRDIDMRLSNITAPKRIENLIGVRCRAQDRFNTKIVKLCDKIVRWIDAPSQFTFELEEI